jgi:DNA-binding winged helix-turn-helix (wHTH) protein
MKLSLDSTLRTAERNGEKLPLRPLEFDLLLYLSTREGRVVTAQELCAALWPGEAAQRSRLTVHLHNLREALRHPLLHSVADGYVLSATPPAGARRIRHRINNRTQRS